MNGLSAIFFALALLLAVAWCAFAAEPTPDPRRESIAMRRQILTLQQQIAGLLLELTPYRLQELEREEEKIKAEKPKPETKTSE